MAGRFCDSGLLARRQLVIVEGPQTPFQKKPFPFQLSCSVGEMKVLWLELLHSSLPPAEKPGRAAGMVPIPEGGVDLLLEAAVWEAEGIFGGSQNDPRHFPKVKAKKYNGIFNNEQLSGG